MNFSVVSVQPQEVVSVFARLYGLSEQDALSITAQMTSAWVVQNQKLEILGAIGVRPSPAHGAEVLGGAFEGLEQQQSALQLIQGALAVQPRLYAYAEKHLLPAEALQTAGLRCAGSYTRLIGPVPTALPVIPDGFTVFEWSTATQLEDRLAAQRTYSDRIGHSYVTAETAT